MDKHERLFREGLNRFQTAWSRRIISNTLRRLRRRSTRLWDFAEVREPLHLRHRVYRGLQDVPLKKIVGSVARTQDFSRDFLPTKYHLNQRWANVYARVSSSEGLPPVTLYRVGDTYFVVDGHHRISVAKMLDATTIQAEVIEYATRVDLRPNMALECLPCYYHESECEPPRAV